jgi:hypothetical protein
MCSILGIDVSDNSNQRGIREFGGLPKLAGDGQPIDNQNEDTYTLVASPTCESAKFSDFSRGNSGRRASSRGFAQDDNRWAELPRGPPATAPRSMRPGTIPAQDDATAASNRSRPKPRLSAAMPIRMFCMPQRFQLAILVRGHVDCGH